MYTGGTTGLPKGVLTRQSWLYKVVSSNGFGLLGQPIPGDLAELRAVLRQGLAGPPSRSRPPGNCGLRHPS